MPCLTIAQHVYKIIWPRGGAHADEGAPPEQGMRGCKVEAPTQVLSKANWATILRGLRKWLAWTAIGIGNVWQRRIVEMPFGLGVVREREQDFDYNRTAYKVTLLSKDGIGTNECIVADEQLNRRVDANGLCIDLQYDTNCAHHRGSLSTKPAVLNIDHTLPI